nr:hypothetical protein [Tanacetum cinerariifolium]
MIGAAYDDSYGLLQHPEVSLMQSSSNEPFQASHNPLCLEHLINGLDHGRFYVLITFSLDCLWKILHPNPFQTIIKSIANIVECLIGPVRIWLSKVEPLLVAFDSQLKIFHTSLNDDASCKHPKRDIKIESFLNELVIVTTYRNPIQMLVAMPFNNLEIRDGNDPPLEVYIESRFLVNSEPIELLTFPPPVRDSPKGMLVIVYWLL